MTGARTIAMRAIGKSFFETRALDGVDFACRAGEVHALVGLNGAGKSTLMKVLGGVVHADSGAVEIDGRSVRIDDPADAARHGIAMIHQEYSLIDELTVAGNIYLGREIRSRAGFLRKREMADRVRAALERFGLALDPRRPVRDLNSGEKQIVEIIRAIMSDAWLIVMDEPTSALAEADKGRLFAFVDRMKAEGIAVVYISHHMPEIFAIAERVTVMRDGRIVLSEETAGTTEDAVIAAMTGTELDGFVKPAKTVGGEPLLSVRGLTKHGAYADVGFDVRPGEIVVLSGLRGCGAAEVAKAVFGLDAGYGGTVSYRGRTLKPGRGPAASVRDGMGLVTENRDVNGILAPLSVRDNIALPFLHKRSRAGLIDGGAIADQVERAVADTSTKAASPDQEIRFLSGGNKQKICFARWLDRDIELLILLEPTRGIDVHAKADIYRIIEDLAARGVGILVLSYEIDEAMLLADRVVTLYGGRAVGSYGHGAFDKDRMLSDMAGSSYGARA